MEDTTDGDFYCNQLNGTFIPGNTCAEIDCELGACLLPDGTCVDGTTEDECDAFGGSWMGIAALCDELGACCFGDHWEQCVYADLLECAEVWGGIWKGEGTQCSTVVCEWRAACCIQSSTCINTTESLCQAFNGLWFEGVTCSVFPCHNLGACIFADGSCVDTITDDECTTKGGYHYYPQTLCSELGACCASENLEICEVMPLVVCEWFNGFWYGFETNCTVVNCPPCLEDVTGDGVVDVSDILEVIGNWGSCEGCNADVNGDGTVGVNDLLAIVGAWGVCP
jgi:hypothetical protein